MIAWVKGFSNIYDTHMVTDIVSNPPQTSNVGKGGQGVHMVGGLRKDSPCDSYGQGLSRNHPQPLKKKCLIVLASPSELGNSKQLFFGSEFFGKF